MATHPSDIKELAAALNEFQAELVTVGKGASNPFFKSKYADLSSIMLAAQPVLTKHGLSVMQLPDNLDGHPALTTIVMHASGQSIQATVPLILAKEDPQGVGSAITYARRYGYAAALQIVIDEDDDGNRASKSGQTYYQYGQALPTPTLAQQRKKIMEHLAKQGISVEKAPAYLAETYDVKLPLSLTEANNIVAIMAKGF